MHRTLKTHINVPIDSQILQEPNEIIKLWILISLPPLLYQTTIIAHVKLVLILGYKKAESPDRAEGCEGGEGDRNSLLGPCGSWAVVSLAQCLLGAFQHRWPRVPPFISPGMGQRPPGKDLHPQLPQPQELSRVRDVSVPGDQSWQAPNQHEVPDIPSRPCRRLAHKTCGVFPLLSHHSAIPGCTDGWHRALVKG